MIRTGQENIYTARATQSNIMEAKITAVIDDAASMKLAMSENEIAQGDYKQNVNVSIIMTDSEKTQSSNECPPTER